jgi:putative redox protein
MTIEASLCRSRGALTTLSNGRHVWNADVDKTLGSNDVAPDPHDLLDSALAACTALTMELYLRRQGWPVTSLQIKIDHVETRGSDGRAHYQLQREITVTGDLTDEQRARLLEIAGKCPIHRVLEGQVSISTRLS